MSDNSFASLYFFVVIMASWFVNILSDRGYSMWVWGPLCIIFAHILINVLVDRLENNRRIDR